MQIVRLVKKSDFSQLARIYADAYNSINIGEKWDVASAEKLLKHFYKEQNDLFFVAEIDSEIVGAIVSLAKPWWDGNHLTDGEFFVSPSAQGMGVGSLLIKHMFEVAQEQYKAVVWDTFTHRVHKHPLEWYKKIGFSEIKEWTMISGDINKVLENLNKKTEK